MQCQANNNAVSDAWSQRPGYQQLTGHDIWWLRRGFLERLWPKVSGWQVAEVGSGPAHDSLTLAERGAEVTAVDLSEGGLKIAREMYRTLDLASRSFEAVRADATALPFEDGRFDLAFNGGVLEHFENEQLQQVIDEMIRIVRPGGHVLAFCPNRYNIFYQTHLRRVDKHSYEFERAFTAHEIRCYFEARGLNDVQLSGVHVHPAFNYLLPSWLPKHHRIEPAMRRAFGWLERARRFHRIKSLIGQDFVVWAKVPPKLVRRRSIASDPGGHVVRGEAGDVHRSA